MDDELDDERADTPEQALKYEILAAMADHLRLHGSRNWALVRERPEFAPLIGEQAGEAGRRKFYRWLKSIRERVSPDKTRPHEARAVADQALADASERAKAVAELLPTTAPSPAFFLKMGGDAEVRVNALAAIDEVWSDLQLARAGAFDGDIGGGRVKSSKALVASAKERMHTLEAVVRLMKEIYDFAGLRRQYEAIIDIVVTDLAGVPEIQARVLARLDEVSGGPAIATFAASI